MASTRLAALLALARPEQWLKNGFVLLPLFFGHRLMEPDALWAALLAAAAFCLLSSAVYAINDVIDADSDRSHAEKCARPVACGSISVPVALAFAVVLATAAAGLAAYNGTRLMLVLGAYLALQLAYSFVLKRIALLDVTAIALGFMLRVVAGGVAIGVALSPWIVVMSFLLALMLALGKRHGELFRAAEQGTTAQYPAGYTLRFLELALATLAACTVVAYVLYTLSPEVVARHGDQPLYPSALWVLLGVLRYLQQALASGAGAKPSRLAWADPVILIAVVAWITTLGVLLY